MSVSNHPIALRLEQRVGGATKLLATVMGLPLVDGIFPALVIAGALTYPWGILQTGLLIFGGSATVAVILAEMEGSPREKATSVLLLGIVLIPVAVVEAAFAEALRSVLNFAVFHRFAGLVILAIAAKTASAEVGEYLPSPGAIIGLGLIASFQPSNAQFVVTIDPAMLIAAGASAGTGIAFALGVALAAPQLRGAVDIDRFRFGSAVALGMLALEVLGLLPTEQPVALGVLAVTALFSYDPDSAADAEIQEDSDPSDGAAAATVGLSGSDESSATTQAPVEKSPALDAESVDGYPEGATSPASSTPTAGAERTGTDAADDTEPADVDASSTTARTNGAGTAASGESDEVEVPTEEDVIEEEAETTEEDDDDTPERPPYL